MFRSMLLANIMILSLTVGLCSLFLQVEKLGGTLMEQLAKVEPVLDDLRRRRDERVNEFLAVQLHIVRLQAEISGTINHGDPAAPLVDETDLSIKRLTELKTQLNELQAEKVGHLV
jgi:protein regulator of cytokinesis 1